MERDGARPAQRVTALNRFIHDVYHGRRSSAPGWCRPSRSEERAVPPRDDGRGRARRRLLAHRRHRHRARRQPDGSGSYYVLEDNLRVPSGVSYMLENRKMMMRLFPSCSASTACEPVAHYPDCCARRCARWRRPAVNDDPGGGADARHVQQRLLRARLPGAADGRGAGRGPGPVRRDNFVYMRTTQGPEARGRDLPPRRRRLPRPAGLPPDSTLGVRRAAGVYRAGNVTLCNAIGTGVADDKSIYPYVPEDGPFYLGEKPILATTCRPTCAARPTT